MEQCKINHMTPQKEEAIRLVDSFREHVKDWDYWMDEPLEIDHAKICALKTVDEIVRAGARYPKHFENVSPEFYWTLVVGEIKKL